MGFFSNIRKLFRNSNPAPPWFKLDDYANTASFDLCDWLEQLFIRYHVKQKVDGAICLLSTDVTFDYIHKIGHGIIEINPTHSCRAEDALTNPGQFVNVSAMQVETPIIQLPDDMVTVMQEWHETRLLPFIDIMIWQRIKDYEISQDALMQALEMNEDMLSETMPKMMEQVLSTDYLRALNHYAISQSRHGLPRGCLDI